MASFQKRGKTWQYTVSRYTNGKYDPIRKGGFRTKGEARAEAVEIENMLKKGGLTINIAPIPFHQYFKEWYNLYKVEVLNLSNNTLSNYKYSLKIIKEHFGETPLQNITRRQYQKFISTFGKTKSKETVDKIHSHIRACVREAIREKLITDNFTDDIIVSAKVSPKKKEDKYLGFNESVFLLNEVKRRLDTGVGYYLILLALTSGLRYSEMVGLTKEDFCFSSNTIHISKTWAYSKRMGSGFGPLKNVSSERVINMDNTTMEIFKYYLKTVPKNENNLAFYSAASKHKVISNTDVNKLLNKTLKDLKIKEITLHGLRHTHASILIYKKELTLQYISERLGHKDTTTTSRVYSHVLDELREEDSNTATTIFKDMYQNKPEDV